MRDAALRAGRAAALRGMTDTIAIYSVETEWDEATLTNVEVTETHYLGPGKIQSFDAAYEQTPEAGAHTFVMDRSTLHLPHDAQGAVVDRFATVTASRYTPALIGRVWRIANTPGKSQATALRLPVEEEVA